jgi:hypothetical protein
LGKFVKSVIEKKKAVTNAMKLNAAMKGKQGLYTFYTIWFKAIESYIKGNPSWIMRQAWNVYVIPFIPGGWTCDDKDYVGVKAKRRCQLIQHELNKTGKISKKHKLWLKCELLPAFRDDFRDKNLDFDKLGEMNESHIEAQVKKAKGEKRFKEMFK